LNISLLNRIGDEKKINIINICTIGFISLKNVKMTAHINPRPRPNIDQSIIDTGRIRRCMVHVSLINTNKSKTTINENKNSILATIQRMQGKASGET